MSFSQNRLHTQPWTLTSIMIKSLSVRDKRGLRAREMMGRERRRERGKERALGGNNEQVGESEGTRQRIGESGRRLQRPGGAYKYSRLEARLSGGCAGQAERGGCLYLTLT